MPEEELIDLLQDLAESVPDDLIPDDPQEILSIGACWARCLRTRGTHNPLGRSGSQDTSVNSASPESSDTEDSSDDDSDAEMSETEKSQKKALLSCMARCLVLSPTNLSDSAN